MYTLSSRRYVQKSILRPLHSNTVASAPPTAVTPPRSPLRPMSQLASHFTTSDGIPLHVRLGVVAQRRRARQPLAAARDAAAHRAHLHTRLHVRDVAAEVQEVFVV